MSRGRGRPGESAIKHDRLSSRKQRRTLLWGRGDAEAKSLGASGGKGVNRQAQYSDSPPRISDPVHPSNIPKFPRSNLRVSIMSFEWISAGTRMSLSA